MSIEERSPNPRGPWNCRGARRARLAALTRKHVPQRNLAILPACFPRERKSSSFTPGRRTGLFPAMPSRTVVASEARQSLEQKCYPKTIK